MKQESNRSDTLLTEEQSKMLTLLIQGETITDIANFLNRSRQTIYEWLKKPHVNFELNNRRQDLTNQGNAIILKDLKTYINNIKDLAKDDSDKRVALAANQYLINRVYGSPTNNLVVDDKNADSSSTDIGTIEKAIEDLKCNHTEGTEIITRKANKLEK
jgi:predicted DNA-binding protein YlxM (UPF0122 family)